MFVQTSAKCAECDGGFTLYSVAVMTIHGTAREYAVQYLLSRALVFIFCLRKPEYGR